MANAIPAAARVLVTSRELGRCFRCGVPLLHGEVHHRRSRSVRDEHTHHACNMIWLCRTCHRWAHAQPLLARIDGTIVSRHEQHPGLLPVIAHFATLLLGCDGKYRYVQEERPSERSVQPIPIRSDPETQERSADGEGESRGT